MKKIDVSATLDALSASLSKAGHPIRREAFTELDAATLGSSEELMAALKREGVAGVLLHGVTKDLSQQLQHAIGIGAKIEAPYVLIRSVGSGANSAFHIVEGPNELEGSSDGIVEASGKNVDVEGEPPENHGVGEDDVPTSAPERLSDEEIFGTAVAQSWSASTPAESLGEPIQSTWIYTKTYRYRPSGNTSGGYTPPNNQEFTVVATYIMTGVLSQVASGDFQYLVAETRLWSDPGGMKKDGSSARGWGHKFVDITMDLPSSAVFHEASPGNTNSQSTVTTGVSLDVGVDSSGPTAGVTWSKSTSSVIKDWHIVLERFNRWVYAQSSPFNGRGTSFPHSAVKSDIGGNNLKGWPDLTRKVLDQAALLVGRIDPATSARVQLAFNVGMSAVFMRLQDHWISWDGTWWSYLVNRKEYFTIDMSTVLPGETSDAS